MNRHGRGTEAKTTIGNMTKLTGLDLRKPCQVFSGCLVKVDPFLDMFADDPEMVDQIVSQVM